MTSTTIPNAVLQWQLAGKPGNIRSQNSYDNFTGYNLFSQSNNRYLTWVKQPLGFNLGYITDPAIKRIHFRLPDNQEREIRTGEIFALGIGGGEAFIRYETRSIGINLEWDEDPNKCHEWKIFGADGISGKPIPSGSRVAIVNQNVKPEASFFIYLDRQPPGVADVGWDTSPSFWDQVQNTAEKALVTAVKKALF
jgi:hypothetical protein